MEQERLDIKYQSLRLVKDDKVLFAPVKNPKSILDISTGTRIWAIDAGDFYPEASITAIDLSPIQPSWCVDPIIRLRKITSKC